MGTEADRKGREIGVPEKLYFSIGEVSDITHLPPYVLRFWENKFKEIRPQKSRGGHRRYQRKDIEVILGIKELLHEKKFTIHGAQKELKKTKGSSIIPLVVKRELQEILRILD
ncbi:MAG: MerR family transcriptional regulator [bacterium]